jgi:hypothetical protein
MILLKQQQLQQQLACKKGLSIRGGTCNKAGGYVMELNSHCDLVSLTPLKRAGCSVGYCNSHCCSSAVFARTIRHRRAAAPCMSKQSSQQQAVQLA